MLNIGFRVDLLTPFNPIKQLKYNGHQKKAHVPYLGSDTHQMADPSGPPPAIVPTAAKPCRFDSVGLCTPPPKRHKLI